MKMTYDQLTDFIENCADAEVLEGLTERLEKADSEVHPSLRKFLDGEDDVVFHFVGDELKIALNLDKIQEEE